MTIGKLKWTPQAYEKQIDKVKANINQSKS